MMEGDNAIPLNPLHTDSTYPAVQMFDFKTEANPIASVQPFDLLSVIESNKSPQAFDFSFNASNAQSTPSLNTNLVPTNTKVDDDAADFTGI